ncbi:MAG: hypothetical protein JWM04_1124, partial [Verrucomicrobiales bacterium]|nr:hypothetical protein [Verrucomicrobiales bacterium]
QPDDLSGPESNKPSPLFPPGQTIWINADDQEEKENTPSPTPLSLLPPRVKNPPSLSPPLDSGPELASILDFENQLMRFLNDLSSQFKQLRSQVRHLDKNDFLGARLDPVMMEVSSAIHEMEQACAEQNPNFLPSRSASTCIGESKFPPQNSQVRTQGEPSAKGQSPGNEAQHQTREVEPRPEIASPPRASNA